MKTILVIVIVIVILYFWFKDEKYENAPIEGILTYKKDIKKEVGKVVLPHLEKFENPNNNQSLRNVANAVLLNSTIDYTNTPGTEVLLQQKLY